jgi:succinyl-CoA synthetase beta subunit
VLLDEDGSKGLLEGYGILRPAHITVSPDDMTVVYSRFLEGPELRFPLVVKTLGSDIAHKGDVGGVRVGIWDHVELMCALRDMRARFPGNGVLIEEYIPNSVEFIVGVMQDQAFGPVVMFGAGGALTELHRDTAFRVLPLDRQEAWEMVLSTNVGRVFTGYRGMEMDRTQIIDAIMDLSRLALDLDCALTAVEVNPLVLTDSGPVALDAKVDLKGMPGMVVGDVSLERRREDGSRTGEVP